MQTRHNNTNNKMINQIKRNNQHIIQDTLNVSIYIQKAKGRKRKRTNRNITRINRSKGNNQNKTYEHDTKATRLRNKHKTIRNTHKAKTKREWERNERNKNRGI